MMRYLCDHRLETVLNCRDDCVGKPGRQPFWSKSASNKKYMHSTIGGRVLGARDARPSNLFSFFVFFLFTDFTFLSLVHRRSTPSITAGDHVCFSAEKDLLHAFYRPFLRSVSSSAFTHLPTQQQRSISDSYVRPNKS